MENLITKIICFLQTGYRNRWVSKEICATAGAPMGLVNWFSVHPTSMPRSNQMISGDHKGLASQMFERRENPAGTLAGQVCNFNSSSTLY